MPRAVLPRHDKLEAQPRRRGPRQGIDASRGRGAASDDPRRFPPRPGPESGGRELPRVLMGLRVLVVDDDHDILELFAVALTACGADVISSDNARDALARVVSARPHVVVSDIAMVGQDGYWLVREIRTLGPETPRAVPVIAATAYGREHPRERVLAAGFTEHLRKPIDPETLCRTVAAVAGR